MADPFIAEIRIFGFNFAPRFWAFCDGQILSIAQNTALFSLLGTTYGGNGQSTFALPDMRGSAPMFFGQGPGLSLRDLGERAGMETVTLVTSEIPAHQHTLAGLNQPANSTSPAGNVLARSSGGAAYSTASNPVNMNAQAIDVAGGSQPHNNMMPYLTLNFCIALAGIFPPRQ
jgi:microcystin-dependent protein